jgi:hypothetical protein
LVAGVPGVAATGRFGRFPSFLPKNVELIENSHVSAMEKPDLFVAGFPCQGFSRASGQARGLADPRTHLLTEALRVIHLIHWRRRHCGWLIENVDATDHPIDNVRRDFNEVVKRLLGEGVAYDAILVGSYAHRYWRYWQNLIPGPLLHEMVENGFLMGSVDQHVHVVLEPGRFAQICQHNQGPWTAHRCHAEPGGGNLVSDLVTCNIDNDFDNGTSLVTYDCAVCTNDLWKG